MTMNLPRAVRVVLAVALTLLLMPCLGFGAFGILATGEPGTNSTVFLIGYITFLLVQLAVIVMLWRFALRTWPCDLPSVCRGCGYDLRGKMTGPCPECGRDLLSRMSS